MTDTVLTAVDERFACEGRVTAAVVHDCLTRRLSTSQAAMVSVRSGASARKLSKVIRKELDEGSALVKRSANPPKWHHVKCERSRSLPVLELPVSSVVHLDATGFWQLGSCCEGRVKDDEDHKQAMIAWAYGEILSILTESRTYMVYSFEDGETSYPDVATRRTLLLHAGKILDEAATLGDEYFDLVIKDAVDTAWFLTHNVKFPEVDTKAQNKLIVSSCAYLMSTYGYFPQKWGFSMSAPAYSNWAPILGNSVWSTPQSADKAWTTFVKTFMMEDYEYTIEQARDFAIEEWDYSRVELNHLSQLPKLATDAGPGPGGDLSSWLESQWRPHLEAWVKEYMYSVAERWIELQRNVLLAEDVVIEFDPSAFGADDRRRIEEISEFPSEAVGNRVRVQLPAVVAEALIICDSELMRKIAVVDIPGLPSGSARDLMTLWTPVEHRESKVVYNDPGEWRPGSMVRAVAALRLANQ